MARDAAMTRRLRKPGTLSPADRSSLADMDGTPTLPRIGGLSLEQYSGVTQAVSEGFPLDEVLAQERIPSSV